MIHRKNTLSNTLLSVDTTEQCFVLEGECIPFIEVETVSQTFTEHYVNGIYIGKLLEVEIHFRQQRPAFKAHVDTRQPYDYARLFQLVYHLNVYRQQEEQVNKPDAIKPLQTLSDRSRANALMFLGAFVFTVFALNGWFELYWMDSPWVEIPSLLAQILLPIALLVVVLQWFWLQPSERKQKQKEEELEEQVIAGTLPEPSNPSWFKAWSWLWISLAGVALTFGLSLFAWVANQ